jgi:hypothetical protein
MKNIFSIIVIFLVFIFLQGCNNDDVTKTVSTDGSIETELSVAHLNDHQDVLTTKHLVWVGGNISKRIVHSDTIPSLGLTKTEAENDQGDKITVPVKRDFAFYITVK